MVDRGRDKEQRGALCFNLHGGIRRDGNLNAKG